jgi:hypothetical protein
MLGTEHHAPLCKQIGINTRKSLESMLANVVDYGPKPVVAGLLFGGWQHKYFVYSEP